MTNSTNRLPEFTFINLFSGIGNFRQALEAVERNCVFSNEWDKYARNPYHQYGAEILIEQKGDITRRDNANENKVKSGESEYIFMKKVYLILTFIIAMLSALVLIYIVLKLISPKIRKKILKTLFN